MIEEFQEQQRKRTARMRSITDFTMGAVLFLVGIFFLTYGFFGIKIRGKEHSVLDYFIGGMFAFYGIWRIYRGYKKDYFQ